jgi:hypothetical protein
MIPAETLAASAPAPGGAREPSVVQKALNSTRILVGRVLTERLITALPYVVADVRRRSASTARAAKWTLVKALGGTRAGDRFNRILDDRARVDYRGVVRELGELVPDLQEKKIPRANVQQAFVFDTVRRFAAGMERPRMLCIGSYEDSACAALKKKLGYSIDEIDPVVNQLDLAAFCGLATTKPASYDVIFSTSVLEHVRNDEEFVRQVEMLLAPGGVSVHTCDFLDGYQAGDPLIGPNYRFYTRDDLSRRFLGLLAESELVDSPEWECSEPDFHLGGFDYTFATLVFRKRAAGN